MELVSERVILHQFRNQVFKMCHACVSPEDQCSALSFPAKNLYCDRALKSKRNMFPTRWLVAGPMARDSTRRAISPSSATLPKSHLFLLRKPQRARSDVAQLPGSQDPSRASAT